MSKYFKFIGVIDILSCIIMFFIGIMYISATRMDADVKIVYIVVLVITCLIIGPSSGLLFLSHGDLLDRLNHQSRTSTYSNGSKYEDDEDE